MGGTILNVFTVLLGSGLGLLIGHRLSERLQSSVVTGLGLITMYVGIDNAAQTGNVLIPLLSISIGVIIGESLRIDLALERFAGWLQASATRRQTARSAASSEARDRFITGFVTASLVYCVGPLAFLGSIQDGMGLAIGFEQLAIKSVLDGFASLAFAASFGIGVAFSALSVFVVQGGLSLVGMLVGAAMSDAMIAEMTATGGVILMGLSLVLLDIKKPRIANFLPALLIVPLLIVLADLLGINIYPL